MSDYKWYRWLVGGIWVKFDWGWERAAQGMRYSDLFSWNRDRPVQDFRYFKKHYQD